VGVALNGMEIAKVKVEEKKKVSGSFDQFTRF
jgi:hypothetical protein